MVLVRLLDKGDVYYFVKRRLSPSQLDADGGSDEFVRASTECCRRRWFAPSGPSTTLLMPLWIHIHMIISSWWCWYLARCASGIAN